MRPVQFPVNLNLAGRAVLVVGGGRIALRKTGQLLSAGASLTVVAPEILEEFDALGPELVRRPFRDSDLDGKRLVVTATGVRSVDQEVFDGAERRGIWVNSADDPERCTFTLPAVVRRGSLLVTASTGGASPALSSYLRNQLDHCISAGWADVADDLSLRRDLVHQRGVSTESIDWVPIIEEVLVEHGIDMANFHGRTRR
ncbi:MAG: precorrin-2 dehydrogenase/sirohydrochlorin ferrochelatase family protein [Ilumatobacteraceae bacterium]